MAQLSTFLLILLSRPHAALGSRLGRHHHGETGKAIQAHAEKVCGEGSRSYSDKWNEKDPTTWIDVKMQFKDESSFGTFFGITMEAAKTGVDAADHSLANFMKQIKTDGLAKTYKFDKTNGLEVHIIESYAGDDQEKEHLNHPAFLKFKELKAAPRGGPLPETTDLKECNFKDAAYPFKEAPTVTKCINMQNGQGGKLWVYGMKVADYPECPFSVTTEGKILAPLCEGSLKSDLWSTQVATTWIDVKMQFKDELSFATFFGITTADAKAGKEASDGSLAKFMKQIKTDGLAKTYKFDKTNGLEVHIIEAYAGDDQEGEHLKHPAFLKFKELKAADRGKTLPANTKLQSCNFKGGPYPFEKAPTVTKCVDVLNGEGGKQWVWGKDKDKFPACPFKVTGKERIEYL
jgi:quinol monooxygenase YgiN